MRKVTAVRSPKDVSLAGVRQPQGPSLSSRVVHSLIAEAAYYRAEKRGFAPGYDMDDWLDAEAEVVERLRPDLPDA
jgi:hypothetical protein